MKHLVISLFVIFSAISVGLSSSETSEPSLSGRIVDVPGVICQPPTNSLSPIASTPDAVLIAEKNGVVYYKEKKSEKILWSFKSGPPIYASYQALDNYDNDEGDACNDYEIIDFSFNYGEDWNIYIQVLENWNIITSLTAKEFIKRGPFFTVDGGVVLGKKNTIAFIIDPKTGKVICRINSDEHPSENTPSENVEESTIMPKKDFKELLHSHALDFMHKNQSLYVFRKDYSLKYFSIKTGKNLLHLKFSDIDASL